MVNNNAAPVVDLNMGMGPQSPGGGIDLSPMNSEDGKTFYRVSVLCVPKL